MASLAAGTALTLTAHQGLEAFTVINGADVEAGAIPNGTFAATPTGAYTKTATGFTLTMPSGRAVTYNTTAGNANVTGTQEFSATATGSTNIVETTLTNGAASTLTYSTYGVWVESTAAGTPLVAGTLAAGVQTATAQMPTTGTATYTGKVQGVALNATTGGTIDDGLVTLTTNFAAGTVNGTVSNIVTHAIGSDSGPAGTTNNINLTGGTIASAAFSGTATVAAATGTPTIALTGASGTFGGKFFGPAAAEATGSIVLAGGSVGANVLASFGAKKQ